MSTINEQSDYVKFRGKCKEFCEALISAKPDLRIVRGYYFDPYWNREEQHWWCIDRSGKVVDPTAAQFPSNGNGIYREFDGTVECVSCGKTITEDQIDGHSTGRHIYCSYECFGADVM